MTEWPRTIPFDFKCKLEQLQEWRSKPSLQDEWTTIREWLTKHEVSAPDVLPRESELPNHWDDIV
ncbi:hypothetical protein [Ruegeria sp. HKCCD7221]|uniref:hypothetical protein n=1 Tax=Ruegeria sp. HKCCD7221 TaxID=2683009 RepID=UPI00147DE617|nr:hypothetical protein [Ruegeria sp. HKCCD7221]